MCSSKMQLAESTFYLWLFFFQIISKYWSIENRLQIDYTLLNNVDSDISHHLTINPNINIYCPANKKRFWNVRLWLYEGLGELNVLRMLYQRSTLVI